MQRIDVTELDFIRVEPRGKGVIEKFWVNHNSLKKLVKINGKNCDQDIMEKISSLILKRLGVNVVDVDLGYDKYSKSNCCLITSFLTDIADTFYDTYTCDVISRDDKIEELRLCIKQIFDKYSSLTLVGEDNLRQLKKDFIRIIFSKCLIDNLDSKLENIGLIFNEENLIYRIPPSFDNGLAFSNYKSLTSSYCCVGNQYFETSIVVDYLIANYWLDIEDIALNLNSLINDLDDLISPYLLDSDKRKYIINYMNGINEQIKLRSEYENSKSRN